MLMNVNKEHALKTNYIGMEMICHIYSYTLLSYFSSICTTSRPWRAPEYLVVLNESPKEDYFVFLSCDSLSFIPCLKNS